VTLRCIADRLLPEGHQRTYLRREIINEKIVCPPPTKRYHVYCSRNNPGAIEMLKEFAKSQGLTLKFAPSRLAPARRRSSSRPDEQIRANVQNTTVYATHDIEQIDECDSMLVYLTSRTWTRGDASCMFGFEVGRAMDADIPLLLVHEMIGVGGQETRCGCEFASFFSCDDGATPPELLRRGIYAQIAVALKGGEWRKTSMVMLAKAFAGTDAVGKGDANELKQAQAMSKEVQQELRLPASAHAAVRITARGRGVEVSSTAKLLAWVLSKQLSPSRLALRRISGEWTTSEWQRGSRDSSATEATSVSAVGVESSV